MNQYVSYITSAHQKPNFQTIVNGLTQPFDDINQLNIDLNINTATNYMLDILGGWIGISRFLSIPTTAMPAEYDTMVYGGWDSGLYYNEFQSVTTVQRLGDEDYRLVLKLKILENHYNGTASNAYTIFSTLGLSVSIQDHQNMSMTIIFHTPLSLIQQALISQNIVNLAPFGVSVQYIFS